MPFWFKWNNAGHEKLQKIRRITIQTLGRQRGAVQIIYNQYPLNDPAGAAGPADSPCQWQYSWDYK
jgi:hypothetical protein